MNFEQAAERALSNSGCYDLKYVEPDGSFMNETVKEIEEVTQNQRDKNFNNWLPKLAEIASRGELEAALVLQELYSVAHDRGFNEANEAEEGD